jgi:hypothetical protein
MVACDGWCHVVLFVRAHVSAGDDLSGRISLPIQKCATQITYMALAKCEKCGAELAANSTECSNCGTALGVSEPKQSGLSESAAQRIRIRSISIIAGVVLLCFLIAAWAVTRKSSPSTNTPAPVPAVKVDVDALRAKADAGDAEAQKDLGKVFAKGDAVRQSYAEAAKWYQQAADKGNAAAQNALGELYEAGQGVPLNEAQAAKCYRQAADQGFAAAQYNLAVLYVLGKGVPQSTPEALKLYQQAAEQGDALAQYNLGMRYHVGTGVTRDPVEAFKWLTLAAAQGMQDATKTLDELKPKMSRDQLAEGRRRAESFVIKKPGAPSR